MTAQNKNPVQLELGEIAKPNASEGLKQNPVQLEIAGIVDRYADAASEIQKGAMGDISKLSRAVAFGTPLPPMSEKPSASPYEPLAAGEGGVSLVLKEDPAKNPELLAMLEKFNKKTALEKLSTLDTGKRERIMGYYKLARTQP